MKGNWNEQKGKLLKKFAILTDNDFLFVKGRKDEIFGRLQIKFDKTKEELQKIFPDL